MLTLELQWPKTLCNMNVGNRQELGCTHTSLGGRGILQYNTILWVIFTRKKIDNVGSLYTPNFHLNYIRHVIVGH